MDIAYYLSDLLGELGEVNVPDLGSFTQQKIVGYYNSTEGKFYPPTAKVDYSQSFIDDDVLAEYIAEKKKISIASSKYFIEKYSSKIKVDVMMEDVQLAGLGWIYPKGDGLAFKKSDRPITDPAYYGYPQIEIQQLSKPVVAEHPEAIAEVPVEEPVASPVLQEVPVAEPEILSEPQHQEAVLPTAVHDEPIAEAVSIEHHVVPTMPPVAEEMLVADPVDLIVPKEEPAPQPNPFEIKEEPVKAPLDFGASMEDYLRELEGGSYTTGPETVEPPKYTEPVIHEPVIESPQHEIVHEPVAALPTEEHSPQPLIESLHEILPQPVAALPVEEHIPEPVIEVPEAEHVPQSVRNIPFPEHIPSSYTPDAELQSYILDKTPAEPQAYTSPNIKSSQEEEEFVFEGKGYDNVDTRHSEKKSYLWLWITLLIIVIVAGAAAFAYYKHDQKIKQEIAQATAPKPIVKNDTLKKVSSADSLKDTTKNNVIKDTTQKVVTPVAKAYPTAIDSTKIRYELIGIKCKTMADAELRIKNYQSLGINDAHIVTGPIDGMLIKVSLGTYTNITDAIKRKQELVRQVSSIEIKKINPKK